MKKKVIIPIISAVVLLILVFFLPIPKGSCNDGGTREYKALTYKIVVWNRLYAEEEIGGEKPGTNVFHRVSVYFYPDSEKNIDELFRAEISK